MMKRLLILCVLLFSPWVWGQGYSLVNFSQNTTGSAPSQTQIFNSWYGSKGSGSDTAFGCTIGVATCDVRISNSASALTVVAQSSSVCGTAPANLGPSGKILDYATANGAGASNQYVLFNVPAAQASVQQFSFWWCSNIPVTSSFGTTFDAFFNITNNSRCCNYTSNNTGSQAWDIEGAAVGSIQYVPGNWVQVSVQHVNSGRCLDTTNFTDCDRVALSDISGNLIGQIAACDTVGGGTTSCAAASTTLFYLTMGNLNAISSGGYGGSFHVQFANLKVCTQGCTASQFPMLQTPVPLWDGILTPGRGINWTTSGPPGGIPSGSWSQCVTAACNTVVSAGTSATVAQINSALSSASASTYVGIASGTYNFSTGMITFPTSGNVELRATGNTPAKFVFSGGAASCGRSGTAFICGIDAANANITNAPTVSWSAGYTQGTTATTLSSVSGINTTSASLPTLLVYGQCDTGLTTGFGCTTGSNADNGQLFISDQQYNTGSSTGCCGDGPGNVITNRGQAEIHVASSIVGSVATLTIPISMPNIVSGQIPAVLPIQSIANFGLRNIQIVAPTTAASVGISFQNAYDWWIVGAAVTDPNGELTWGINCLGCANGEIRSSYVYDISGNANPYGIRCMMCSYNLFDNNIIQSTTTPFSFDGSSMGDVVSYNYCPNATFHPVSNDLQPCFNEHAQNDFDYYEGNIATQLDNDGIHGTAAFQVNFRNGYTGWWSQPSDPVTAATNAKNDASFDRYMADLFGLYGSAIYHTTYTVSATCTGANAAIWLLGTGCPYAVSPGVPTDSLSAATLLRYGNYDTKTAAVRFCGNALNTGWSSPCGSASEVPVSATAYPNFVPVLGDTTIGQAPAPSSFYLSGRPSWYSASVPFPLIGPDVSSGNLLVCSGTINTGGQFSGVLATNSSQCAGQGSSTAWGGHGNANPAMLCAISLGMPVDGSGSALAFDNNGCYGGTVTPPPTAPASVILAGNARIQGQVTTK